MIVPVMHQRVKYHLDQAKSPRLSPALIDAFLTVAMSEKYLELCRVFQTTQQIRDELKPLVTRDAALTPTADVFTYPVDYYREVAFALMIDGVRRNSTPTTYDELNELSQNAFTEPSAEEPVHIESGAGVKVYYTGTLTLGYLSYITTYLPISYSQTFISAGPAVLTIGVTYYVQTGSVTHNSVTYAQGGTFVAASTVLTGTGTVAAIQNCQLAGEPCHENICVRAAQIIAGSLEDPMHYQVKSIEAAKN